MEVLQRRCPDYTLFPSRCILCFNDCETIDHLFVSCPFVCRIWLEMTKELEIPWCNPVDLKTWLEQVSMTSHGDKRGTLFRAGTIAILWAVWMERNHRIFADKTNQWEEVWDFAKRCVASVTYGHKALKAWSWSHLCGGTYNS
ncbi:hypothetical protein Sjap_017269 [Stephania japonica]|uniref:Reverse transcriptase zinc-binding domain-containing protein n=1 Tax=Stephania japonica TaxID=461633 RepID=A0AAP0NJQ0_9MAGN